MNKMIEDLRARGAHFILVVIQVMNWLALTVGGVVLSMHEIFPSAVPDYAATLSPAMKLLLLAVWNITIHFFLRQAKRTV